MRIESVINQNAVLHMNLCDSNEWKPSANVEVNEFSFLCREFLTSKTC